MNRQNLLNRLELKYNFVVHEHVHSIRQLDRSSFLNHGHFDLSFNAEAAIEEFYRQTLLIR